MLLCIPRRAPQRSAASVSLMPAREKASESLCSVHLLHIYPLITPPSWGGKNWTESEKKLLQKVPKIVLSMKLTQKVLEVPLLHIYPLITSWESRKKHKEGKLLSKTRHSNQSW